MEQNTGKKRKLNIVIIDIVFLGLLLCGIVLAVCVGKYSVSPGESISILWNRLFGLPSDLPMMT